MSTKPRILMHLEYEEAAQAYLRSLPPEHFMEATPQATQRKITLESLDLVQARRPEIQVFNELLVQYALKPGGKPLQVVPDNLIVVWHESLKALTSYNVPLQPVGPTCVMEYVSKGSKRKDYDDNMRRYERELKVPYYLLFYPDDQELTVFRHNKRKYVSIKPNEHGRLAIPDLELEVALREEWVRYWFRGELLPLPADLQRDLDQTRRKLQEAEVQLEQAKTQLDAKTSQLDEERRARLAVEEELARLRAQLQKPGKSGGRA
jgi:Uma2 family endonuclease